MAESAPVKLSWPQCIHGEEECEFHKEKLSFLGYRIESNFSSLAAPLTDLLNGKCTKYLSYNPKAWRPRLS